MNEKRYVVIRTSDEEKEWIWKEIKCGRVRQGWGISNTQLKESDKLVDQKTWVERYKNSAMSYWNDEVSSKQAITRYKILANMATLKQGDTIIIPKMPSYGSFVLARVVQEYEFDFASKKSRDGCREDYRHIINLDISSIKTFNYMSSTDTTLINRKLRAYQSAVNNVYNEEFIKSIEVLHSTESDETIKEIDELFREIKIPTLKHTLKGLRKLNPRDLENLVAMVFENAGYEVIKKNHYDKEGGDVDIILSRRLPIIDELRDIDFKIYIQVKHKNEIDYNDIHGVNQLNKITEEIDGSYMKLLVSSADKFTQECRSKANSSDVILINGIDLVDMMIKYI